MDALLATAAAVQFSDRGETRCHGARRRSSLRHADTKKR
jgi:hypothetical protein